MYNNKKMPTGALVAAGLAAFAYYKYSKMSTEEKESLVGDLKDKAQKMYEKYAPEELKTIFTKQGASASQSGFDNGTEYGG